MNKNNKHIELGLTPDELIQAVKSAGDFNVLKSLDDKLENCDLSRPSIELVNEADLKAVIDISKGINSKYLGTNYSNIYKKLVIGFTGLLFVIGGIFIFPKEDQGLSIVPVNTETVLSKVIISENEIVPREEHSDCSNELISSLEQSDYEVLVDPEEVIIEELIDSARKDTTEIIDLDLAIMNEEINKETAESVPGNPIVSKKVKAPRRVRGVIVTGTIDDKYKGDSYKIDDLVDFQGGNDQLQKEIYNRLKSKVKTDDIPSLSTTIVFNFEVNSRGKVKDVSVQSRTTPELESIIIQTINSLDTWNKGSKRASKNYSVFVTFK